MGLVDWENQVCSKQVAKWVLDFSKILAISTRLVVVSIYVRAKNSTVPCGVDAGHEPMRSTATSSQGVPAIPQLGSKPLPGPEGLAR